VNLRAERGFSFHPNPSANPGGVERRASMVRIARVAALLIMFCCLGPIQGGEGNLYAKPVYDTVQDLQAYAQVSQNIKQATDTRAVVRENQKTQTKLNNKVFIGKASWYGPNFHGKLTANGEVFDQNAFTAAHRELPFGTKVLVTNLTNGKSTVVTINDRGPYVDGRHIDLSKAAAQEVGMLEAGVVDVMIRILSYE